MGWTNALSNEGGSAGKWVFPEWDNRLPESVQRKWDYMGSFIPFRSSLNEKIDLNLFIIFFVTAPEYALDEQLSTSSDLYSLGCVIYAVHLGGRPPFQNKNSLSTLRTNMDRLQRREMGNPVAWNRLGNDLKGPFLLSFLFCIRSEANFAVF